MKLSVFEILSVLAILTEGAPVHEGSSAQKNVRQSLGDEENENVVEFNEDLFTEYQNSDYVDPPDYEYENLNEAEVVIQFNSQMAAVEYAYNGTIVSNRTFERKNTTRSYREASEVLLQLYEFFFLSFYPGATDLVVPTHPPFNVDRGASVFQNMSYNATLMNETAAVNESEEEEDYKDSFEVTDVDDQQNVTNSLRGTFVYYMIEMFGKRFNYKANLTSERTFKRYNVSGSVFESSRLWSDMNYFITEWFYPDIFNNTNATQGYSTYYTANFKKTVDEDPLENCDE